MPFGRGKNAYADQTDGLANNGQVITFTSVPTTKTVEFKAMLNTFSDQFQSEWNSESVYGRMDPIQTFKRTGRVITFSFDVVAANLFQARENLMRMEILIGMLYPTYKSEGSMGASTINSSPFMKVKFLNWIAAGTEPLFGTMNGFNFEPNLEHGVFENKEKHGNFGCGISKGALPTGGAWGQAYNEVEEPVEGHIFPKVLTVNCTFTVIHTKTPGWNVLATDEIEHTHMQSFPYQSEYGDWEFKKGTARTKLDAWQGSEDDWRDGTEALEVSCVDEFGKAGFEQTPQERKSLLRCLKLQKNRENDFALLQRQAGKAAMSRALSEKGNIPSWHKRPTEANYLQAYKHGFNEVPGRDQNPDRKAAHERQQEEVRQLRELDASRRRAAKKVNEAGMARMSKEASDQMAAEREEWAKKKRIKEWRKQQVADRIKEGRARQAADRAAGLQGGLMSQHGQAAAAAESQVGREGASEAAIAEFERKSRLNNAHQRGLAGRTRESEAQQAENFKDNQRAETKIANEEKKIREEGQKRQRDAKNTFDREQRERSRKLKDERQREKNNQKKEEQFLKEERRNAQAQRDKAGRDKAAAEYKARQEARLKRIEERNRQRAADEARRAEAARARRSESTPGSTPEQ